MTLVYTSRELLNRPRNLLNDHKDALRDHITYHNLILNRKHEEDKDIVSMLELSKLTN
jgi:hypothetical protein